MASSKPLILERLEYYEAAQAYLHSLPPEHFMEPTSQANQRMITLESLDQVCARRPEIQLFNELLVQYRLKRGVKIRQVVPDNMVVVHPKPIKAEGSFDVALQPVGPFWVLEYVTQGSKRKDYDDNFKKYERELKVPYYLLFSPEVQELSLYRRGRSRYVSVTANAHGRFAVPELEVEVALLDGWTRFWFRGELLPLAKEWQRELDRATQRAYNAEQEIARLRAELERLRKG
jgi:hypothetical protein